MPDRCAEQGQGRDPDQDGVQLLDRPQVQRSRLRREPLLDEHARPRHTAITEITREHVPQGPALQVRTLNFGAQENAMAQRANTMSEFHVLDLWARIGPFVVASGLNEDLPADGPTATPERLRLS